MTLIGRNMPTAIDRRGCCAGPPLADVSDVGEARPRAVVVVRRYCASRSSSIALSDGCEKGGTVASMMDTAMGFFQACESGKGWDGCSQYCPDGATSAAQAEPLADVTDLQGYAEWMKGLMT